MLPLEVSFVSPVVFFLPFGVLHSRRHHHCRLLLAVVFGAAYTFVIISLFHFTFDKLVFVDDADDDLDDDGDGNSCAVIRFLFFFFFLPMCNSNENINNFGLKIVEQEHCSLWWHKHKQSRVKCNEKSLFSSLVFGMFSRTYSAMTQNVRANDFPIICELKAFPPHSFVLFACPTLIVYVWMCILRLKMVFQSFCHRMSYLCCFQWDALHPCTQTER